MLYPLREEGFFEQRQSTGPKLSLSIAFHPVVTEPNQKKSCLNSSRSIRFRGALRASSITRSPSSITLWSISRSKNRQETMQNNEVTAQHLRDIVEEAISHSIEMHRASRMMWREIRMKSQWARQRTKRLMISSRVM